MKPLLIVICAFFTLRLEAEGYVQVSSLVAEPVTLDCQQHRATRVAAQVYFYGIEPTTTGPRAITLHLGTYTANPATNKLKISEEDQTVLLKVSPAIAKFDATCGEETTPGEIKFVATILTAPAGVKIGLEPLFAAAITITGVHASHGHDLFGFGGAAAAQLTSWFVPKSLHRGALQQLVEQLALGKVHPL